MYEIYYKDQHMHFGVMNVILSCSDYCVLATHVAIFRVVTARIHVYL